VKSSRVGCLNWKFASDYRSLVAFVCQTERRRVFVFLVRKLANSVKKSTRKLIKIASLEKLPKSELQVHEIELLTRKDRRQAELDDSLAQLEKLQISAD
jgi:hypothetical protein